MYPYPQTQVPHSVIQDRQPTPAQVVEGGIAVNLKDYRIYSKGYDGVVIRLSGRVEVHDDEATNAAVFLPWVKQTAGNLDVFVSSAKLSFNPSTGQLSATSFAGDGSQLAGVAKAVGAALAPAASDLATVIALANSLRAAAVSSGIGS